MVGAVLQAESNSARQASMLWLIGTYLFHTIGELCLSPTGLSMVTRLAPARYLSLMMGVWFGFTALANFIAGLVGSFVEDFGALSIFSGISAAALISACILWVVSDRLVKWIAA